MQIWHAPPISALLNFPHFIPWWAQWQQCCHSSHGVPPTEVAYFPLLSPTGSTINYNALLFVLPPFVGQGIRLTSAVSVPSTYPRPSLVERYYTPFGSPRPFPFPPLMDEARSTVPRCAEWGHAEGPFRRKGSWGFPEKGGG